MVTPGHKPEVASHAYRRGYLSGWAWGAVCGAVCGALTTGLAVLLVHAALRALG